MSASEYTKKYDKRYFSVCQKWKDKKWTHKESKEWKFEEKKRENGWAVLIFT